MLQFTISDGLTKNDVHVIQAKIIPGGCGTESCQIDIRKIGKDGKSYTAKKSFSPDLNGYMACLKETEVYDPDKNGGS